MPSTPSSRCGGRAREWSRERLHPHVAHHDQVLLVVHEVQLAERRVRSRACQVGAEVVWARAACGGPTQRRTGLGKALEKASSLPALACATMLDHSASPSVARTCLGMRVSSPLQRCYARLRAISDSLTGGVASPRAGEMNRHPWAAVVPGLRAPAVTDRSGIPAGRRLGERPRCRR